MTTLQSTTDNSDRRQALYEPLKNAIGNPAGELVGSLITKVAADQNEDLDLVVAAMWDLVESGSLDYGTNARVRRSDGAKS